MRDTFTQLKNSDHKYEHWGWTHTIYSPHQSDTPAQSMYSHMTPCNYFHLCNLGKSMLVFQSNLRMGKVSGEDTNRTGSHRCITEWRPLHHLSFSYSGSVPQAQISKFLKRLSTSLTGIRDSVSVQIELLKAVVVLLLLL